MSYFSLPGYSKNEIKFELDFPNHTTKPHLKGATDVDTWKFAKKADLASLIANVNNLVIGNWETTPADLRSLAI